jgi:predicted Fe-Mo cluster-binding NifX family protein
MKIACASTNGIEVNEHFGTAAAFYIFTLENGDLSREDVVKVNPYSSGDQKNHPFAQSAFERLSAALQGCKRVYVVKIGETPARELRKIGIEPVIYTGDISAIR